MKLNEIADDSPLLVRIMNDLMDKGETVWLGFRAVKNIYPIQEVTYVPRLQGVRLVYRIGTDFDVMLHPADEFDDDHKLVKRRFKLNNEEYWALETAGTAT